MKTSLLSTLLLLVFASSGLAWDWSLGNIKNLTSDQKIPASYFGPSLGEGKVAAGAPSSWVAAIITNLATILQNLIISG